MALNVWFGDPSSTTASWSVGTNWSLGSAPAADDIAVFIISDQVYSPNVILDQDATIAGISFDDDWGAQGGTLQIDNDLVVNGDWQMASGTILGPGTTTINGDSSFWTSGTINLGVGGFVNNGTWTMDTSLNNLVLNLAGTLTNNGTIRLDGTNELLLERNAIVDNAVDGTFNFVSDSTINALFGGTLQNSGLLRKSSGVGTSTVSTTFFNSNGTIEAQSGTLKLRSQGRLVFDGNLKASVGAKLDLTGGVTVNYRGSFVGSGGGMIAVTGGVLAVDAAGVTFNLPGSLLQWTGGAIDVSSGGTVTNQALATVNVNGANMEFRGAGTLNNNGRVNIAGVSNFVLKDGAVFNNGTSGKLYFTGDSKLTKNGPGTLNNSGLIQKSGGAGTSRISSMFNNAGAKITATSGTLALETNGGLIDSAIMTASAGATINLANFGTVDYAGSLIGSGGGTIALTSNTIRAASSGLTLNFPGALLQWIGGTINLSLGNVTNVKNVNIGGTASFGIDGAGSFINSSSIVHSGSGTFQLKNAAVLNNTVTGTFELKGDGDIGQVGVGTFQNVGMLKKTMGTDPLASFITSGLNNLGTIQVSRGTLTVSGALSQISGTELTGGIWNVNATAAISATLRLNSAPSGVAIIGSGAKLTLRGALSSLPQLNSLSAINGWLLLLAGKQFTSVGNLTNTGKLTIDSTSLLTVGGTGNYVQTSTALLSIKIGGTNAAPVNGTLRAKGLTLAGKLTVTSSVQPSVGSVLTILDKTAPGLVVGTFTGKPEGSLLVVNGTTYTLSYLSGGSNDVSLTAN
jgi:hypothetical protein